jgi:hypothetical protein
MGVLAWGILIIFGGLGVLLFIAGWVVLFWPGRRRQGAALMWNGFGLALGALALSWALDSCASDS